MTRSEMISDLKNMGYYYNFYKYSDKQIYFIHKRTKEKVLKQKQYYGGKK